MYSQNVSQQKFSTMQTNKVTQLLSPMDSCQTYHQKVDIWKFEKFSATTGVNMRKFPGRCSLNEIASAKRRYFTVDLSKVASIRLNLWNKVVVSLFRQKYRNLGRLIDHLSWDDMQTVCPRKTSNKSWDAISQIMWK